MEGGSLCIKKFLCSFAWYRACFDIIFFKLVKNFKNEASPQVGKFQLLAPAWAHFFLRLSYSSQIKTKLKIIYFVDLSLHMYRVSTKKVHFSFINQWLPSLVCDWPIYTEHTLLLCEFWSAMICWCLGLLYYSFKLSQKELTMKTQAQCLFWILVCHDLLLPVTSIP